MLVDFEFDNPDGENPDPVCMCAIEVNSGRKWVLWADELRKLEEAPFRCDEKSLCICFMAVAEMSCFLVLDWTMPFHLLDLYVEQIVLSNGISTAGETGFSKVLKRYGLNSFVPEAKEANQKLALKGLKNLTPFDKKTLLRYVEERCPRTEKFIPKNPAPNRNTTTYPFSSRIYEGNNFNRKSRNSSRSCNPYPKGTLAGQGRYSHCRN